MNSRRGFTLIELLVVIAIIGILAGTLIYSYSGVRGRARDAKRIAELNNVRKALEIYSNDHTGYPVQPTCATLTNMKNVFQPTGKPAYLPEIPQDPKAVESAGVWPDYCYISTNGTAFVLWAKLETGTDKAIYQKGVHEPSDKSEPKAVYLPNAYFEQSSF